MKTPSRRITAIVGGMVALVALLVIAYIASRGSCKLPDDGVGTCLNGQLAQCSPGALTYTCVDPEEVCGTKPQCDDTQYTTCDPKTKQWSNCVTPPKPTCKINTDEQGNKTTNYPIAYYDPNRSLKSTKLKTFQDSNSSTFDLTNNLCVLSSCNTDPNHTDTALGPDRNHQYCVAQTPRDGSTCVGSVCDTRICENSLDQNGIYQYLYNEANKLTPKCTFEKCTDGTTGNEGFCGNTDMCGSVDMYGMGAKSITYDGTNGKCTLMCEDSKNYTKYTYSTDGKPAGTSTSGQFDPNDKGTKPYCVATSCTGNPKNGAKLTPNTEHNVNKCVADCGTRENLHLAYGGNIDSIYSLIDTNTLVRHGDYDCNVEPSKDLSSGIGNCYEDPNSKLPLWLFSGTNKESGKCNQPANADRARYIGPDVQTTTSDPNTFRNNLIGQTFFLNKDKFQTGCQQCEPVACKKTVTPGTLASSLAAATKSGGPGPTPDNNPGCYPWNETTVKQLTGDFSCSITDDQKTALQNCTHHHNLKAYPQYKWEDPKPSDTATSNSILAVEPTYIGLLGVVSDWVKQVCPTGESCMYVQYNLYCIITVPIGYDSNAGSQITMQYREDLLSANDKDTQQVGYARPNLYMPTFGKIQFFCDYIGESPLTLSLNKSAPATEFDVSDFISLCKAGNGWIKFGDKLDTLDSFPDQGGTCNSKIPRYPYPTATNYPYSYQAWRDAQPLTEQKLYAISCKVKGTPYILGINRDTNVLQLYGLSDYTFMNGGYWTLSNKGRLTEVYSGQYLCPNKCNATKGNVVKLCPWNSGDCTSNGWVFGDTGGEIYYAKLGADNALKSTKLAISFDDNNTCTLRNDPTNQTSFKIIQLNKESTDKWNVSFTVKDQHSGDKYTTYTCKLNLPLSGIMPSACAGNIDVMEAFLVYGGKTMTVPTGGRTFLDFKINDKYDLIVWTPAEYPGGTKGAWQKLQKKNGKLNYTQIERISLVSKNTQAQGVAGFSGLDNLYYIK